MIQHELIKLKNIEYFVTMNDVCGRLIDCDSRALLQNNRQLERTVQLTRDEKDISLSRLGLFGPTTFTILQLLQRESAISHGI